MQEMRDEAKAEEQPIAQERAHADARLAPVAVLRRRLRELDPLPPAVTLEHTATVRDALEVMQQHPCSCVLVVEQGHLVGVFTERDVVTKVAATTRPIDHVPLRDVMQPDPDALEMDDELVYAFHQMHLGEYRHIPVVDAQRRPAALLSMQTLIGYLIAALPQDLLNLPPSPLHSPERAPTPEGA
jgi:CBS domain-containing protein